MRFASSVLLMSVIGLCPWSASAQFGFNSKRETYDIPIAHPPLIALPKVKRLAVRDFAGPGNCARDVKSRIEEAISKSDKFELIDRANLSDVLSERDLQASSIANPSTAVKLGQLLGPAAIISGQVLRCSADTSSIKKQAGFREKNGLQHYNYFVETTAHALVVVRVIDVTTSKVNSARRVVFDLPQTQSARDGVPEPADGAEMLDKVLSEYVVPTIMQSVLPWTEVVRVTVHADKECDLKAAAGLIRIGSFDAAAESMQKSIASQCGNPKDKIALAKAYHNLGIALTYAGRPEEGLKALQQASLLWPGNISEEAIVATQKIIQARDDQRNSAAQDMRASQAAAVEEKQASASVLTNADIIAMVRARLSDKIIIAKIRSGRCRFDTSPSALIQLKKSAASDAVVLAFTEAQCVA